MRSIENEEPDFGLLGSLHRSALAFLLDRIGTVAQPGGVGEHDGVTAEIDRDFDYIPRGAGDRRGNRHVATGNPVEKARFAGVRGPDDRDVDAVAQSFAAMPVGQVTLDFGDQRFGFARDAILDFRGKVLVRKIDCRLEVREDAGQTIAPATINLTQLAAELPHCLAALSLGLGRGEIGDCLGLQQIELAVEEGAAGEFAGLREPQPEPGERLHDGSEHGAAAVQMEFRHILAGRTPRRREPQDEPVIEHVSALRIDEAPPLRDPRRRQAARKQRHRPAGIRPREAQDRDRSASRRRRRCENRPGGRVVQQDRQPAASSDIRGRRVENTHGGLHVLAYCLVKIANDDHRLHRSSGRLFRRQWRPDLTHGGSLDPHRRRIGSRQLHQWRIDSQPRHQRRRILGRHQHPAIDAVHICMRAEIVRVGPGDQGDGIFIDGDLGSVERANGDHAGLSSKVGQGAHCTPPAKSSGIDRPRYWSFDRARVVEIIVGRSNAMAGMLEGKIAVVTGAGGGIGREIALAMARAGAKVVINDVGASLSGEGQSATPAEETKQLIEQGGGAAAISTNSVAEWSSAQKIVQAAVDHFGGLDIVVNNAGVLRDQIFHRMTAEDWLAVISVHLNGSFFVSRAAADQYRKQESGAYVHITSTSGLIGNMGQANYASAKLGITALSKAIAIDMKRFNVRSNCLSPWAWSRMTQSIPARTEEERARVAKIQQMTPDKNAPIAVFLASDAARDVTGQVFGTRMNEIYLFSSPRPIRSLHRADGWTPEAIAEHALPALQSSFMPLDRSGDVFSWDPL